MQTVFNTYYSGKRYIFYRGLKKVLGLEREFTEQKKDDNRDMVKMLEGLTTDLGDTPSCSYETQTLKRILGDELKYSLKSTSGRGSLERIDHKYSFDAGAPKRLTKVSAPLF